MSLRTRNGATEIVKLLVGPAFALNLVRLQNHWRGLGNGSKRFARRITRQQELRFIYSDIIKTW